MHLNMIIHLVNPLEFKNGVNKITNNIYTYKQKQINEISKFNTITRNRLSNTKGI
jgi:hypothetical protein